MSFKAIYTLAGAAILALGLATGGPPSPAAGAGAVAQSSAVARG
ncbi:MAG: hypothetical protein ACK4SZ_05030 [Allosphingosinicella sp.]